MSTFATILEARSFVPERHVVIKPNAFADDWRSRPQEEIALGLRRISDADIQTARAEAQNFAVSMHDDYQGALEAYNDALMRWLIVRGTCDANDIRINAPVFDGSEENVRNALTSNAIRYIWDHVEKFHIETSPIVPEATDEEFVALMIYLKMPALLDPMSPAARRRFRKLVTFLLDEIRTYDANYQEPDPDENAVTG